MDTKDHEKWAKIILAALVERTKNFQGGEKYITYGELARQIGYPEPHIGDLFGSNIGKTLGTLGHMFDGVVIDGETIPLIQSLVVSKTKKLPSDGLKEFDRTYPSLSKEEKRDFVNLEYDRIFRFGERWERVLEKLGIPNTRSSISTIKENSLYNPYGSEGSPEHKALIDFIAANPTAIGIHHDNLKKVTEYPLRSGDKIDLVFETSDSIIGIEVKSKRSGIDDLERGLYQCVKYAAVLEATNKVENKIKNVSCLLVLEGELTNKLKKVQKILGITVYPNISSNF